MSRKRRTTNSHGAFATTVVALLGQGLIYLCITGEISVPVALATLCVMGIVMLAAVAVAREQQQRWLVTRNLPPAHLLHRSHRFAAHQAR